MRQAGNREEVMARPTAFLRVGNMTPLADLPASACAPRHSRGSNPVPSSSCDWIASESLLSKERLLIWRYRRQTALFAPIRADSPSLASSVD